MDEQSMCFVGLNDKTVQQILLRLHSKILFQFKCVCKSWDSFISSPQSIAEHLVHTQDQNSQIILRRSSLVNQKDVISLFSSENVEEFQDLPYDKIFLGIDLTEALQFGMDILCCNHLLCLRPHVNDKIILMNLNPKETEFKILPVSHIPRYPSYGDSVIGFGFDSNTSDYKVVRIIRSDSKNMPYILQIEIYSLKSDSWRQLDIEDIPDIDFISSDVGNMYVNGRFYWYGITPVIVNVSGDRGGLLSFDMSTEMFDFTPLQVTESTYSDIDDANIFLLNDHPGMICIQYFHINGYISISEYEVFVLLEHGVEESWTKLYSLDPLPIFTRSPVLGCWKNGELFMQSENGELYLYEPLKNEFRNLNIPAENFSYQILQYRDSEQNSKFKILKLKDKNLPIDVIKKILLRMQSKNLIKCRSICKLWNTIIWDINFILKYRVPTQYESYRTIVKCCSSVSDKYVLSLFSSEDIEQFQQLQYVTIFNSPRIMKGLHEGMDIFPCNHLICLKAHSSSEIIIWNPKEAEFEILPESEVESHIPYSNSPNCEIGFGFDLNTSYYKVVRIVRGFRNNNKPYIRKIEIYSLQTKSWRQLKNIPPIDLITSYPGSMYVNGRCYWYGSIRDGHKGLLSFDMHTELFDVTQLPVPQETVNLLLNFMNIFVLNGHPGMMIRTCHIGPHFDIWVLLEHGVPKSWTRLYSIEPLTVLRRKAVIGCRSNGELFIEGVNGKLYLYDPFENLISKVDVRANHRYFQIVKV